MSVQGTTHGPGRACARDGQRLTRMSSCRLSQCQLDEWRLALRPRPFGLEPWCLQRSLSLRFRPRPGIHYDMRQTHIAPDARRM
jgi:hypothetical protein